MDKKNRYYQFCEKEETIPLFSQAWWLDSVCGDNWDACIVQNENEIIATMPYFIQKRHGLTLIIQPPLTQTLGPWIRSSDAKYSKILAKQKDIMQDLIEQLPKYHFFSQNWHYSQTNWLPFYWNGFQQTTRYTYVINDISNINAIWQNFSDNIRTDIKKAENRFKLVVRTDLPIEEFYILNKKVFDRQMKSMPYDFELVNRISKNGIARNQCKWFIAQDQDKQNHAGVMIIWDNNSAYYLMGGGDPVLRNSGATSLCMWEAIKFASTVTKRFDFEGSMIESIERFFRSFGAIQTPYFSISKTPSRLLRAYKALRMII